MSGQQVSAAGAQTAQQMSPAPTGPTQAPFMFNGQQFNTPMFSPVPGVMVQRYQPRPMPNVNPAQQSQNPFLGAPGAQTFGSGNLTAAQLYSIMHPGL